MDERLQAIKDRLAAATPGPWKRSDDDDPGDPGRNLEIISEGATIPHYDQADHPDEMVPQPVVGYFSGYAIERDGDAEFIANAPSDIAYLLSLLEVE